MRCFCTLLPKHFIIWLITRAFYDYHWRFPVISKNSFTSQREVLCDYLVIMSGDYIAHVNTSLSRDYYNYILIYCSIYELHVTVNRKISLLKSVCC